MTTVSTVAAGSATRCGRAPVISAMAASESGITVLHLPRQRLLGRRHLARRRLAELAQDRRGGHLTVVEGDDRVADVLAALMPLARHHTTSPLPAIATARPIAAARSGSMITRARSCSGTVSTPASISASIASGSSERGLSLVRIATSARRAEAAPISGRLARSRSPPQPSTMHRRPPVTGRSARSTASTAPGL